MGAERKIIFECRVGSHLFGLNGPKSDEDFHGVFLPSADDLSADKPYPSEWTRNEKASEGARNCAGDVDRKFFSLKRFIELAVTGQSAAVEMLFAPDVMTSVTSSVWREVKEGLLAAALCRESILPFIGFAITQAHRATIKGENLNKIRALLSWTAALSREELNLPVSHLTRREKVSADGLSWTMVFSPAPFATSAPGGKGGQPLTLRVEPNRSGALLFGIAGREWDVHSAVKFVRRGLKILESRYGSRSEAAAVKGLDFKSLSHAYRLIFEAEELLLTGQISLPLKEPARSFVLGVKRGDSVRSASKHFDELMAMVERLKKETLTQSILPEKPNLEKIQALSQRFLPGEVLFEVRKKRPEGPPRILTGAHLLSLGVLAGPALGRLLQVAHEAQIKGVFSDLASGLDYLKKEGLL